MALNGSLSNVPLLNGGIKNGDILEVQNKDNGLRDSRTNLTSDEEQLDNNESDSNPSTNNKYLSVMTMHVRNGATGGVGGLNSGQISKTASTTLLDQIPENTALTSRRPSVVLQEILSTRRPSTIMAALRRPSLLLPGRRMESFPENGSTRSINMPHTGAKSEQALEQRRKNRRVGDDAISSALSALYANIIVIIGMALPVTEILSSQLSVNIYQGFYIYLYVVSISFVAFLYISNARSRAVFSLIKNYHEKTSSEMPMKKRNPHFGSFYLRVGAMAFGIGTMVYSGLEIGQYFELQSKPGCSSFMIALTPACRMTLSIVQMQFIFLNTTDMEMSKHKVISRFGLMHMIATNLCEWLYVLIEETKHEIFHISSDHHGHGHVEAVTAVLSMTTADASSSEEVVESSEMLSNMTVAKEVHHADIYDCHRTNIMGSLVQNASPFLFPCTIEYSLICAVILYEMWKKVKSLPNIERSRRNSLKATKASVVKQAHHFSVDCSGAHKGMFGGILIIVLTIISLIMYFVFTNEPSYKAIAIQEITITEIIMYIITAFAVIAAIVKMRDLKYHKSTNDHHADQVNMDNTLLVLAQTGVYVYSMFSIIGSYFSMGEPGAAEGLFAELCSLIQTSIQTLFILNASWRKCRGHKQLKKKPGREIVTFLLVANISIWIIYTLIKLRAGFRPTHLEFFGPWPWTIITHVSMPLAIFYRFHSTICLFEIWKTTYKTKGHDHHQDKH